MPEAISEAELEQLLYGVPGVKPGGRKVAEPDWSTIANEHERKRLWENVHCRASGRVPV